MTLLSADELRFREDLERAVAELPVDVDGEWRRLTASLHRAGVDVGTRPRPRTSPLAAFAAVAAVLALVLAVVRPVAIEVDVVRFVPDLVGIEESAPPTSGPPPPTPTVPAPTTTTPPPPTTTSTALADVSHSPIVDDDTYRLTVRRVHEQINDAVGYNRTNLDALTGAAELLEGLVGQDPELDELLRTTIDLLRRAQAEQHRDWAVYAHRLVVDIENRRANR